MNSPTADVSVRVAWSDDAPAIAELQLRAWREKYAGLVPAEALPSDVEAAAAAWRSSLAAPGDARNRVLDLDGEGTTRVREVRLHTALV